MALRMLALLASAAGTSATPFDPPMNWNMQPNLVPKRGMWRGATVDNRFQYGGMGPIESMERAYKKRLHIYRSFKGTKWNSWGFTKEEKDFINSGGIVFYSVEPTNWTQWDDWHMAWMIEKYAEEVKSVAPHKVMVAPGFEPDGHTNVTNNHTNQVYGPAFEYKKMYRNWVNVFRKQNVTNAVFVMDMSCKLRSFPEIFRQLYPGDEYVDWLFFNIFQSLPQNNQKVPTNGNCTEIAAELYNLLSNQSVISKDMPWGLGAWGTMNATYGDPPMYPSKAIPIADRELCLEQISTFLEDKDNYPKIKASIYFNSLNSMISPNANASYGSRELAPAMNKLLHLDVFTANDRNVSRF